MEAIPTLPSGTLKNLYWVVMQLHIHIVDLLCVWVRQRLHLYGSQGSRAIRVDAYHQWREIGLGWRM